MGPPGGPTSTLACFGDLRLWKLYGSANIKALSGIETVATIRKSTFLGWSLWFGSMALPSQPIRQSMTNFKPGTHSASCQWWLSHDRQGSKPDEASGKMVLQLLPGPRVRKDTPEWTMIHPFQEYPVLAHRLPALRGWIWLESLGSSADDLSASLGF